ncbi:protein tyrosine phosphatase [Proteus cibi]|uniref:Protein tyrosine phosphatase n=1 Tax=Proteus cibi TaxID=2050966 RepID=A0ABU6EEN2_9GAMM|nr:protein-tyrosine phosphatase family protein [Proteus cibi]MEB6857130.1 protein tyrosine phosphatase [Proteus cibi]MEB7088649.1 protein tyrosine phosphatase [Proteus cibi]
MHLSPITSSSLIERNKLENTSKEYIIKGNIMNVANGDKDFAPPLPPRKQNSSSNLLPLPPRGINIENNSLLSRRKINNVDMPKFNFSRSNEEVKLHNERENFLVAVKKFIGTDKDNKNAEILFNNLNRLKYNSRDYQLVENARYNNQLMYRKDTLIKSGNVSLPANDVSSYDSPNMTIASQYPFNNKESLNHYFNMLFDNNINTVYVLASNEDIKKDFLNLGVEYKKSDFEKEGFKYFRENLNLDDIKYSHIEKWDLSANKTNGACLDCKTYSKLVTKENSDEKKKIHFVHIYDWKDHTGIDATKLRNTIDIIGGNLKINPTKENIAVHCLAGLGRTGEFIALMEMMKMIEAGNTKGKSLESIISDLREKRSVRALYQPEQIAELVKFAINNNIPLLNTDIKMK